MNSYGRSGSGIFPKAKEDETKHERSNAIINDLLKDFKTLFGKDDLTDFTFTVSGTDFRVHKVIVSARCSVFAAMIQHDMKEKNENHATIDDITPKTFKEILRFIYTGEVSDLKGLVDELIKAADKYDLRGLKNICEDELCLSLCPQNAASVLQFADTFTCEQLKARTILYIQQNANEVMKSDAWNALLSTPAAKLVGEVCLSIANKEPVEVHCPDCGYDLNESIVQRRRR